MLSVDQANCAAAADLRLAVALPFDAKDGGTVSAVFDRSMPCVSQAGTPSLYRIYRLPEYAAPYIISIASVPADGRLFAPRVSLLDANGDSVREIARDTTIFRDGDLSVFFRARKGEDYLLIESDSERVGQKSERVQESTGTTVLAAGPAIVAVHTGNDATTDLVYSHDGSVSITLSPIPAAR
jgi:hypothetical protein